MAGPTEQRWYDQAEDMFVFKGWSYDQIIEQIRALGGSPVAKATISAWNKKGDWNDKRARYRKTRSGVAGQLQKLMETKLARLLAEEGDLKSEDLKDVTRLMTAIEKFGKQGPDLKTMTVEVMGHFGRYCLEHAQPAEKEILHRHLRGFMSAVEASA